jgi:trans-aconitate 2-methyltransferase
VPPWDPELYVRFERERSLPARDLLARLSDRDPSRVVDLGCGTGTSTALLRDRWPGAQVVGLDSSPEMIAAARKGDPAVEWTLGDVRSWDPETPFDVVFSNAALHWVEHHAELFPRLLRRTAPGGTLAVQMPINSESPAHRAVREVAESALWAAKWGADLARPKVGSPEFYYNLLAAGSSSVEVWETEYVHVLPDAAAVLEWVKGTTLRPFLDRLSSAGDQKAFLDQILRKIEAGYAPQSDGHVLFPFRRLFVVAHRRPAGSALGETGK